jgi:Kef-type K+ transport system membrane component KefB
LLDSFAALRLPSQVDDVLAWALLAIILTLVRSSSNLGILWVVLLTTAEIVFMFFVVRPFLGWLVKRDSGHAHLGADTFLYVCLVLIGCSYLAEIIGLSALIGAFQVGLIIPRASNLSHHISEKLEYFTVSILMPIYFASSGLKVRGCACVGRAA